MAEQPSYVVGVGASAGGLEALQAFFSALPAKTGAAFVVLQHLSPDFKSMMGEILAHNTALPIQPVEDGATLAPDTIYLSVPRRNVSLQDGALRLADPAELRGANFSINEFFTSLATDRKDRAIAVVLSGTGSDGAEGLRAVADAGGFTLVQSSESAAFDGMPRAAVGTGAADTVGPPSDLAAELLRHIQHPDAPPRRDANAPPIGDAEASLAEVVRVLREGGGHDFANYRSATLTRRIERRITALGVTSAPDYIDLLTRSPVERRALEADLLIGVTRFFRDPEVWRGPVRRVFREHIAARDDGEPVRVWSAGCSTGEEAYTMAILFYEICRDLGQRANFKIFATDVDQTALDFASAGLYPDSITAEIGEERANFFFQRRGSSLQVRRFLRHHVVFAAHDVVKDPPFPRIDFISCRNLLIYLEPAAQRQLLAQLHFALVKSGVMLIGPSETLGAMSEGFTPIDEGVRLFRKRAGLMGRAGGLRARIDRPPTRPPSGGDAGHIRNGAGRGVHDRVLNFVSETVSPPGLVIGPDNRMRYSFGDVARFLRVPTGEVTLDAFAMLIEPVRHFAVTTVRQARGLDADARGPISKEVVLEEPGGVRRHCMLKAWPLRMAYDDETCAVLAFELGARVGEEAGEGDLAGVYQPTDYVRSLEAELMITRQSLQETVEELETSNEELQSSNEELIASNEELQSTNEELHSVNEELQTVNAEFHHKINELTQISNDFDHLLDASQVRVVFIDSDLTIRRYTPAAAQTFPLLEHDVGRSILAFNMPFEVPDLEGICRRVMDTREMMQEEVATADGAHYVFNVYPFIAGQDEVAGVVIKLSDITALREADAARLRSMRQFEAVLDLVPAPMLVLDGGGRIERANAALCQLFGYQLFELVDRSAATLFTGVQALDSVDSLSDLAAALAGAARDRALSGVARDGRRFPVAVELGAGSEASDGLLPMMVRDLDDGARVEARLKSALASLKRSNRELERFGAVVAHDLKEPLRAVVGYSKLLRSDAADQLDDESKHYIDRIVASSVRMQSLIDDLLTLASIDSDEAPRRMTGLTELVSVARERLSTAIDQSGAAIDVSELPEWRVNPRLVTQLFQNLISNAIKYRGDAPPNISISASEQVNSLLLQFRDNGLGVANEHQKRIFDVFTRVGGRDKDGTGVGLAICKKIAERHGGEIWVESEPGDGATFFVTLARD